ncbi:permease [Aquibaculum arenosum]|uniref:Permease n=1 Tax=Aquibaculum arenosum TaxID=3032591 RepID=A0ABT5YQM6_9PROT|nr:permease [Fodinicurvata sp. CAU 1616]MDF2097276.1 permease [Fodinicurvata sp. CAU 1616]
MTAWVRTLSELDLLWTRRQLRAHVVWLVSLALLLVLAATVPRQALESLRFTLESLLWIAPFLALSVGTAAWLKAAGADSLIAGVVSRAPVIAIAFAALLGAFSPFCSCGVVPLVAALLAAGVPLPAVMAFWVASPIMDPEMFLLTLPVLGLDFALAKTASALLLGSLAGFATLGLQRFGLFRQVLRDGVGGGCATSRLRQGPQVQWAVWREPQRRAQFGREALRVGLFLAKWLTLAFLIESLMVAWLPADMVAASVGGDRPWAIALAATVGAPAYVNGYAAIPLAGELINAGMVPGAALAFMLAGGMTSIPAAMAVWAVAQRGVFFWYLLIVFAGAMLAGYSYQGLVLLRAGGAL